MKNSTLNSHRNRVSETARRTAWDRLWRDWLLAPYDDAPVNQPAAGPETGAGTKQEPSTRTLEVEGSGEVRDVSSDAS